MVSAIVDLISAMVAGCESWLTAAIPMEHLHCSCMLTSDAAGMAHMAVEWDQEEMEFAAESAESDHGASVRLYDRMRIS